jgi:gliding motility-associated-like protein
MSWRTTLTFAFLIGINWLASAQFTSRLGRFQVDQVKGCAPLTVTVTVIAPFVCDGANPCDMDYEGNNNFESLTFTHTYTQPGNYLLRILFQTSGFDDIPVEVTSNTAPQFDLYTCGNNEISVQLNDSNYDEYIINYNDGSPEETVTGTGTANHVYAPGTQTVTVRGHDTGGADNCTAGGTIITPLLTLPAPTITSLQVLDAGSIRLEFDTDPNIQYKLGIATNNATTFQQAATIYNTTVDTIFNLRTDDNYYCFQLAAYDPCNNTVINSATICSANLDVSVRNNAIDVIWTTSQAGISSYRLERTANDGTLLVTSPTGSPYADVGIVCGTEYCYQLTSNYPNGSQSISLSKCGIGLSTDTPSPIRNISAVVGTTSVILDWQTDPAFSPAEFTIEKSINGNYSVLATTTQNAYSDAEYKTEDVSCYRIRYKDVCDNQSLLSTEACPIRLNGDLLNDNSISLSWSPYTGWADGVSGYTVEKYTQDGILLQTFAVGNATTYVDASDDLNHQTFVYFVNATPVEGGVGPSSSNRVSILKDPNLFHPTAFTPNGDNLNDNFTVFGQYVVDFEMKIFNRWGELLFITDDIQSGWDGTFKGNEMPEGTYTFIAHITDRAGRIFKRSGSVLLLRRAK